MTHGTGAVEQDLTRVGYQACGADQGWGVVRSNNHAEEPKAERKVRFYVKNKSTFLAMIAITQTCDGRDQVCQQNVVVRQTQFPTEVKNRAELVRAICAGTPFPSF